MTATATHNGTARHAAAVEYLAARWPSDGRHGCYLALGARLLRDLPQEDVAGIFVDLVEATGDDKAGRRTADLEDTARKLRDKKPVTGWPGLAKRLGTDGALVVAEFRRLLGLT